MDMKRNLTMLTDFYEISMAGGYFEEGLKDREAVFDMFFRTVPDGGGFAIFAGLEQLIEYIKDLHFTTDDIAFLREKNMFSEQFLDYLRGFISQVMSTPCRKGPLFSRGSRLSRSRAR